MELESTRELPKLAREKPARAQVGREDSRIIDQDATATLLDRFGPMEFVRPSPTDYATQMLGTATFWNRCGEATTEDGWFASFALNSGWPKAAR